MTGKSITKKELAGFENLLSSVNAERLDIRPYAKKYLQHILLHKKYYCRIYARILELVLQNTGKEKEQTRLVDFGAGNGVMGLLAKYAGFGSVFINDINADFIDAAKKLSKAINIIPDGFITGDIETLQQAGVPDAIAGTDVIEHIYSLDHFFQSVKKINPVMVTVMSTACNPANRFKVKEFSRLQIKDEWHGGSPEDGALFGETAIEPFIKTREAMIKVHGKGKLLPEETSLLAKATRGLNKEDIEKAVDNYLINKTLPESLTHPTNTCDPVTGSWSERMLGFDTYKNIYTAAGFEVRFYDGFYNAYENSIKSKLLAAANVMVSLTSHSFAPFIILVGKHKQ